MPSVDLKGHAEIYDSHRHGNSILMPPCGQAHFDNFVWTSNKQLQLDYLIVFFASYPL